MNQKNHPKCQSFRLAQLISETAQTYQKRALAEGIDLQVVNDFVFDMLLVASLRRIKTLFGLVIRNAIDYSGATTITFSTRQLLHFDNHVLLEFSLTDNGKSGKRSFAYYRALVQTRLLVEELHGKSEVIIVPGHSATLKFIIKARWQHTDEVLRKLNGPSGYAGMKGKRVIVADDNDINQLMLRQLFQKEGAVVDIASDGLEVIRLMEQHRYDLVVLDLQMPHMDGLHTANYIRKKLDARVPIIALSVSDHLEMKLLCEEAGVDKVMKKPVQPDLMIADIQISDVQISDMRISLISDVMMSDV